MIYVFTEFVVAVIHSCALFSFMSKLIGNDQILAMNFLIGPIVKLHTSRVWEAIVTMCKAQCEFLIVETPPPSKQTFKTFEQYRQLLYSVKK